MKAKSPLPKKKQTMDFFTALKRLSEGKKIKRLEWKEKVYGVLKDGLVCLFKEDKKYYAWNISDGDLMGEDWIIIK